MPFLIKDYLIGNMSNNTYLLADTESKAAVLVDPAAGISEILPELDQAGWNIEKILLTHAHFDHTYGMYELLQHWSPFPHITLHPADKALYQSGGLGELIGLHRDALPEISVWLQDNEILMIGEHPIQVIHCPGHSPGSVLFYSEPLGTAIVGDSIFQRGIGRTDLPGGSGKELLHNIRQKIFSLPNDTRLLPGHGPATTVEEEKRENPFLMSGSSIV